MHFARLANTGKRRRKCTRQSQYESQLRIDRVTSSTASWVASFLGHNIEAEIAGELLLIYINLHKYV